MTRGTVRAIPIVRESLDDRGAQLVDAVVGGGAHENRAGRQRGARGVVEPVDFVAHEQRRFLTELEFLENRLDARALTRPIRIRRIDDVQQEIGDVEFFERRAKRVDQFFSAAR